MFRNYFYWLIKEISSINTNNVIFGFYSQKKILLVTFSKIPILNDNTKSLFTPCKLGSIKKSKYWCVVALLLLDDI